MYESSSAHFSSSILLYQLIQKHLASCYEQIYIAIFIVAKQQEIALGYLMNATN